MNPIFESENIRFIKVSQDFMSDYLEMVNDIEGVAKFIGSRREPYSVEEESAFIQGKLDNNAPMFSMIEKSSGDFIGNIELMDIKDGCGELGIAITSKKQNMGFGIEAIKRIVEYGFCNLSLKRIFLKAYNYNERAIHVYEQCGFVKYLSDENTVYMEICKR